MKSLGRFNFALALPLASAIGANVLWGSSFWASKQALEGCPPITAAAIRLALAFSFLVAVSLGRKLAFQTDVMKRHMKLVMIHGLLGYVGFFLFLMYGLKNSTASLSASILLLAPVWTFMFEHFSKRESRLFYIFVLPLAIIGALVMVVDRGQDVYFSSDVRLSGVILNLAASVCLGLSVSLAKSLLTSPPPNRLTIENLSLSGVGLGLIILVPLALAEWFYSPSSSDSLSLKSLGWLLYLAIGCSGLAALLWNWSVKNLPPSLCVLTIYIKTPVAIAFGAVFLGEALTFPFLVGTGLIFLSVTLGYIWEERAGLQDP